MSWIEIFVNVNQPKKPANTIGIRIFKALDRFIFN